MKIKDLLTDECKWTKGHAAIDKNGNETSPTRESAVCWCLSGAIDKCYGSGNSDELLRVVIKIIEKIQTNYILVWNDHKKRTFKDIKQLLEELDI